MDRTASEINSWPPPPLLLPLMLMSSLQLQQNSRMQHSNVGSFWPPLLSVISVNVSLLQSSFEHQLLQCFWDILLEIELSWPIRSAESTSKHLNQFCIWERLFKPNDIDAFYHTEVQLRCWIITMRFKCWIFNIKFWRSASTIQANTPKEQLFLFLFDHIAVLQVSLVKFFRGYIFLPSNSEFDLNG